MTLHPDIYWLGRQWAVTGFGIQAVDQKLQGRYDIELSRVGEAELATPLQDFDWFDVDDFEQAVLQARKRPQQNSISFRPLLGGEK